MNLISEIKTAPAGQPFWVKAIKQHIRQDQDIEDELFSEQVLIAVDFAENETWRVLRPTTFTGFMDTWSDVEIHKAPVTSITTVKYFDADDNIQTLASTNYQVNLKTIPATIIFLSTPTLKDKPNAIEIEFVAGYAALKDIPYGIKGGLYIMIEQLYDFRMGFSPFNIGQIEATATNLFGMYNARSY